MVGEEICYIFVGMNFGDKIVRVLDKMVVPEYDRIDHVMYKEYGTYNKFYEIIYVIKEENYGGMSNPMKLEIILKTQSIVPMVALKDHEDYAVYFGNGKRKYIYGGGLRDHNVKCNV